MTSDIRRISISAILATRENNLNALRLIAAILVLFSHSYPLTGNIQFEPIARYFHLFDGGALAVIAFFFLSGYLISASWEATPHFPSFILKRVLRIIPGLAFAVTISALIIGAMMTSLDIGMYFHSGEILKYIRDNINVLSLSTNTLPGVFTHAPIPDAINGSLWTLRTEFWVYIATGIIGATCLLPGEGKGFRAVLFSVMMLYVSARLANLTKTDWEAWHLPLDFFSYRLIAVYLLGTVAFVIRRWLIRSWFLLVGLICGTWLLRETHLFYLLIYLSYGYLLLLLATSPILVLGKSIRKHDYSYGTYIYAFPIQQTIVALLPGISPLTLFLFALPIVGVFAVASWHCIEKPSLKLKGYFV